MTLRSHLVIATIAGPIAAQAGVAMTSSATVAKATPAKDALFSIRALRADATGVGDRWQGFGMLLPENEENPTNRGKSPKNKQQHTVLRWGRTTAKFPEAVKSSHSRAANGHVDLRRWALNGGHHDTVQIARRDLGPG